MARPGDLARARIAARIAQSDHRLTVEYPPQRMGSTGTTPTTRPVAPLTGPLPTPALTLPAASAVQPAVDGIHCLWYDMPTSAGEGRPQQRRQQDLVGWRQGAVALARVLVAECALDPAEPFGATIFDAASVVVHRTHRYRVLEVARPGAGDTDPTTFYVWLATAEGQ